LLKNRKNFSFLNYVWYKILHRRTVKACKDLITVSKFSRKEIAQYYNINEESIHVTYNGWQHINNVKEDKEILKKIKEITKENKYFFSMGTLTKHKNMRWVIETAKNNPNYIFLISGFKNSEKVYKKIGIESTDNVKYLGYLNDEEMKTVIKNAEALLYPTLYEGFGIPPLEAMAVNTKVIVSDIPAIREIYGDTVYYINPYDPKVNLEEILKGKVKDSNTTLDKYSWEKSARDLLNILNKYIEK
jgi:glycosyltransferase involved in cell wall biosynthesis